jgi:hypothetical protein
MAAASGTRQVLVVLTGTGADAHAGAAQGTYRVLTRLPPRLMVVDADDRAIAELSRDPGVARVVERGAPPVTLEGLRPEEQLFVDSWQLASTQESKPRAGDGLSWDAPGFQPPDIPPKTRE